LANDRLTKVVFTRDELVFVDPSEAIDESEGADSGRSACPNDATDISENGCPIPDDW